MGLVRSVGRLLERETERVDSLGWRALGGDVVDDEGGFDLRALDAGDGLDGFEHDGAGDLGGVDGARESDVGGEGGGGDGPGVADGFFGGGAIDGVVGERLFGLCLEDLAEAGVGFVGEFVAGLSG